MRIVTFNLYHDKADWPARRELIIRQLRTLDADVVALQEVLQKPGLRNQAEELGEALGYDVVFVAIDPPGREQRYGNAVLTRLPVLARDWKALEPLPDSRSAGRVRLGFQGEPVDVYFTHLHYRNTPEGAEIRARQVADLMAFVEATRAGHPAIVAGDLNATSGSPELGLLEAGFANGYDRLHPLAGGDQLAHTTLNPAFFPDDRRRIDHVYFEQRKFAPLEARIVLNEPDRDGRLPSDHFGVLVVLRPMPAD